MQIIKSSLKTGFICKIVLTRSWRKSFTNFVFIYKFGAMAHFKRSLYIFLSVMFAGCSSAAIHLHRSFFFPQLNIGLGLTNTHSRLKNIDTHTRTTVLKGPLGLGSLSISTSLNILVPENSNFNGESKFSSASNAVNANCAGGNRQQPAGHSPTLGLNLLLGNNKPPSNYASWQSLPDCSPGTGTKPNNHETTAPVNASAVFPLRPVISLSTNSSTKRPPVPPTNVNQNVSTSSTTTENNVDDLIANVFGTNGNGNVPSAAPNSNKANIDLTDPGETGEGIIDVRIKPNP